MTSADDLNRGDWLDPGWERLRHELTSRFEALADGEAVIVEVTPAPEPAHVEAEKSWLSRKLRPKRAPSGQPYVQTLATGENWLHMEASSNEFLAPQWQLDDAAAAILERLGWSPPSVVQPGGFQSPNYFIDRPVGQGQELAALAVQTFVEAFRVTDAGVLKISQV